MVYSYSAGLLDHLVVDIPVFLHHNPNGFTLANHRVCLEKVHRNRQQQLVHMVRLFGFYRVKG